MRFAVMVGLFLALTACTGERDEFLEDCRRRIELRLTSPASAEYGALKDVVGGDAGDADGYMQSANVQVWLGYVDSSNAFGTSRRAYFACTQESDQQPELILTDEIDESMLDPLGP